MTDLSLEFEADLTDEQSLLNGKRLLSIEGEALVDGIAWTVSLTFERPKSVRGSIEEGDLTLSSQRAIVVAALASGRVDTVIDEALGDERDVFDLVFAPLGDDGEAEDGAGQIEIRGELAGARANLRINVRRVEALEAD